MSLGEVSELRLGYDLSRAKATIRVGDPLLPSFAGREQAARLRWVYDGQDHWMVPSRGIAAITSFSWLVDAPDQTTELRQFGGEVSAVMPLTDRNRLFFGAAGGTSFDDAPSPFRQFTLGGRARLSAFDLDEFRGDHFGYVRGGYLREVGRLPDLFGGPIYALAGVEAGSAFDEVDQARVHSSLTGKVITETVVGPLLLSSNVAPDGDVAFYIALGRVF